MKHVIFTIKIILFTILSFTISCKDSADGKLEKIFISELDIVNGLGGGYIQSQRRMMSGIISIDTHKNTINERTKTYSRLLMNTDLTQMRVFVIGGKSSSGRPYGFISETEGGALVQVNNKEIIYLTKIINSAIYGNRISYSAARRNVDSGTFIIIDGSEDCPEDFMRIYIPNLFPQSVNETFMEIEN